MDSWTNWYVRLEIGYDCELRNEKTFKILKEFQHIFFFNLNVVFWEMVHSVD